MVSETWRGVTLTGITHTLRLISRMAPDEHNTNSLVHYTSTVPVVVTYSASAQEKNVKQLFTHHNECKLMFVEQYSQYSSHFFQISNKQLWSFSIAVLHFALYWYNYEG